MSVENKAILRKWIKEERKKLDIEKISQKLCKKLVETKEFQNAKNIMFYYPLDFEINLLEITNDKTKNFYLPKINGKELLCCPYLESEELCLSCFKTKEPSTLPINKNLIDLVIVPVLAVDKNNYRLGYGGGFYDRFLSDINVHKIACLPKEFVLETVFPEKHDIKIDKIIYE